MVRKFEALQEGTEYAVIESIAYCVPGRFTVMIRVCLSPKIFDKPKSAIFGTIVASISIFSGFRSR
jgi:hypothetical protein